MRHLQTGVDRSDDMRPTTWLCLQNAVLPQAWPLDQSWLPWWVAEPHTQTCLQNAVLPQAGPRGPMLAA